ncbi:hypothetical protein ABPG72_012867 [Tetrahymena utriculariae]
MLILWFGFYRLYHLHPYVMKFLSHFLFLSEQEEWERQENQKQKQPCVADNCNFEQKLQINNQNSSLSGQQLCQNILLPIQDDKMLFERNPNQLNPINDQESQFISSAQNQNNIETIQQQEKGIETKSISIQSKNQQNQSINLLPLKQQKNSKQKEKEFAFLQELKQIKNSQQMNQQQYMQQIQTEVQTNQIQQQQQDKPCEVIVNTANNAIKKQLNKYGDTKQEWVSIAGDQKLTSAMKQTTFELEIIEKILENFPQLVLQLINVSYQGGQITPIQILSLLFSIFDIIYNVILAFSYRYQELKENIEKIIKIVKETLKILPFF